MTEDNNNFIDYAATLAGLIDERVKFANNIRKGVDLAMNISKLLQLKETLQYIQKRILWDCMSQRYCSESNIRTLQRLDEEISNCDIELNSQVNKVLTDKILEELAEFAKRQSNHGCL